MFKDPFILASGPPTRNAEMIAQAFEAGWNSAVTKTICLNHQDMIDVQPRMHRVKNGIQNIELISPISAKEWAEDIKSLKSKYPDKIVIASVSAEAENTTAWQILAKMMQEAGSDVLELNFSCPHGLPEIGMGSTCSDIPELAASITKKVKEISKIPVWVKLSPNLTNITNLAELCINSGANCVTAINTVKGLAGVDIATGKPFLSTYGGISGKLIKPIALKAVSEIASELKCQISASGGVSSWQDAVEFILLGASTVQICTEVMLHGYGIIQGLRQGLARYLNGKTLEDIRGSSLKYLTSFSDIDKTTCKTAIINKHTCINCGKCHISCRDAGYQAIGKNIDVNPEKCTGCGLCGVVCPVGCITLTSLFTFPQR